MESFQDQSDSPAGIAVIMVPFPAQGHLNQLLQLSCLVSKRDIPVYFIGSAVHNRQAKIRSNGLNPLDVAKIRFHDIPIQAFESPAPDPSGSKFPSQLQPAWDATASQREAVADFLREMSPKFRRVVVINDPFMAYVVQDVADIPNAEAYGFNCISAFTDVSVSLEMLGRALPAEIPVKIPSFDGCITDEMSYLLDRQAEPLMHRAGDLFNTCRLMEAPFLEILESKEIFGDRKFWAIGPIISGNLFSRQKTDETRPKCLRWLDEQEPRSVIYVTFGTTTSLSDEEVRELATGLEQSGQKFLWVLRDADKGDIFHGEVRRAQLPEGFEERAEGIGIVERGWAPQPEILAHPSTGAFMSHCGWNSCMESLCNGVPIAAWPMHSDQPRNAYLVTEILKAGIAVAEWERRGEGVKASSISDAVKRLMATEEGKKIREVAAELAGGIWRATEDGGATRLELDSFFAHISR